MPTNLTPPPAPPEPKIEALLNQAIAIAVHAFDGQTATEKVLAGMAKFTRAAVNAQADAGLWHEWSIKDSRDLAGLVVEYTVRERSLVKQAPIRVRWDFKNTVLRYLATWES